MALDHLSVTWKWLVELCVRPPFILSPHVSLHIASESAAIYVNLYSWMSCLVQTDFIPFTLFIQDFNLVD